MYHHQQWNPLVYNCANLNSLDVEDDAVWPGLKAVAGFDQPPTDIIFDHCSDDESDLSLTGSSSAGTSQSSSSIYCDDDVENTLKEVSFKYFLTSITYLHIYYYRNESKKETVCSKNGKTISLTSQRNKIAHFFRIL